MSKRLIGVTVFEKSQNVRLGGSNIAPTPNGDFEVEVKSPDFNLCNFLEFHLNSFHQNVINEKQEVLES